MFFVIVCKFNQNLKLKYQKTEIILHSIVNTILNYSHSLYSVLSMIIPGCILEFGLVELQLHLLQVHLQVLQSPSGPPKLGSPAAASSLAPQNKQG